MAISAAMLSPATVFATNGMNLEGYGAEATAMGGASMAYDNGTAAMMNNPATLGLMDDGSRLDLALGFLGPNVDSSWGPMSWPSKADSFLMPAIGYASKTDGVTWGVGMFAQGGMGTEYDAMSPGSSFLFAGGAHAFGGSMGNVNAADTTFGAVATMQGWDEMSEVGVMRILVPVSYDINDKLNVGGSIDFVQASMDIKMVMTGAMMKDMLGPSMGGAQTIGTMAPDATFGGILAGVTDVYGGLFDFADSNPYTGETTGTGFAGKIGFTYKVNNKLSVGGTYHTETNLGDLTGDATLSMAVSMTDVQAAGLGMPTGAAGPNDYVIPITGKISVKNFQWPATYGLGLSFQASDKMMIVADVKQINWSDVMKSFEMTFDGGAMGSMDMALFQNWDDQTVLELGGAYQVTDSFVARFGVNMANNPIPDATLHYLFPAMVENSYTAGFGYTTSANSSVDFALSVVPEVTETNGMGMEISHSQSNWQLQYTRNF